MSSPAVFSDAPSPGVVDGDGGDSEIVKRMMRVKVLYTFDDRNKTNCLARLPHALTVPMVALDESTQIGVIELKTCIQAIVAASPELISTLEHDYTVYAYDYSEYETPLVGQGMLSRVLASASPTPNAPARSSGTMITGRVCKNILGIFSNGVKETLEVKLKLVPVPSCSQSEYLKNMELYRSTTKISSDALDVAAWNSLVQSSMNYSRRGDQQSQSRGELGGVDSLHDLLMPNLEESCHQYQGTQQAQSSRAVSPAPSQRSLNNLLEAVNSRPSSRTSNRPLPTDNMFDDALQDDGPARKRARLMQTDWQGRSSFGKTAEPLRVAASTAAQMRGFRPSILDGSAASNDLVPRAPTPRPSEKHHRPSINNLASNNIGRRTSYVYDHRSPYPLSEFGLPDDGQSLAPSSPDIPSSPPEFDVQNEQQLSPSSPLLPDLPPPIHDDSGFQSDLLTDMVNSEFALPQPGPDTRPKSQPPAPPAQPAPPVPAPPPKRSNHLEGKKKAAAKADWVVFQPEPSAHFQPTNAGNSRSHERARSAIGLSSSPAISMQPKHALTLPPLADIGIAPSHVSPQPGMASRESSLGPITASISLPPKNPLSQQGKRPRAKRVFPRSQTWAGPSGPPSSDVESDAAGGSNQQMLSAPKSRSKNGSGVVRERSISSQLSNAIATGQVPKYCMNCGEINTPTWRPYWIRVEYGSGENIEIGTKTGIHWVEPLTKNDKGETTTYRIYKQWSHLTVEEKENSMFEQLLLCNPCGDYVRKHQKLRPLEMWEAPPGSLAGERNKKKSNNNNNNRGKKKGTKNGPMPLSDLPDPASNAFTDIVQPTSDAAIPAASNGSVFETPLGPKTEPQVQNMGPPVLPAKVDGFNDWNEDEAAVALQRAIQQSPARILGSQESPIEVDDKLSPNPTRRLLFPSPRKDGQFKSLEDSPMNVAERLADPNSPSKAAVNKGAARSEPTLQDENIANGQDDDAEVVDKENRPPVDFDDDGLSHLFDGIGTPSKSPNGNIIAQFLRTPSSKSTTQRTPLMATNSNAINGFGDISTPSRAARSSPLPLTNQLLTPFTAHINQLLSDGAAASPSQGGGFNFNLPSCFTSPITLKNTGFDFNGEDLFSTDLTMPSSPPNLVSAANFESLFEFYEDSTATTGNMHGWDSDAGLDQTQPVDGQAATGTEATN